MAADIQQLQRQALSHASNMKVNFYIQSCYISLSLPFFLATLFISSPRPMNSVSFHSYHATYTYLITFD